MKWSYKKRKRHLSFEDAVRFNWTMDTNEELQIGLEKLAEQYPYITRDEYTSRMLTLFRQAGLYISEEELRILLELRRKTDQMLLSEKEERTDDS